MFDWRSRIVERLLRAVRTNDEDPDGEEYQKSACFVLHIACSVGTSGS